MRIVCNSRFCVDAGLGSTASFCWVDVRNWVATLASTLCPFRSLLMSLWEVMEGALGGQLLDSQAEQGTEGSLVLVRPQVGRKFLNAESVA